ncbi:WG repeat-containing protein [Chryseobacterium pennipullorum]|uniref:WG repeat-containing protein n=1 Tax=Chryseobacterium pennipullorum TaxID=2258963 RepID=A0A3D9B9J5_9FLAO|nr:WG repeat-containing protein [Chryseobacterium pennipullorum]REC50434.1 WG repeat-containing protein [Chryseobacterium pennipullorum]
MKKILLAIVFIPILSFSQGKEILHYFKTRDSLVGVKNKAGKIIVPAEFKIYGYLRDGDPVEGETILFDGEKVGTAYEKNTWGYVYDRQGNFLYKPFLYDNGPDYFSEGVRRFVKDGKFGFADRNGKTVIEPKHNFASFFNYGYASFCDGCDWEKTDAEHKAIVGGTWGVMNAKGQTVQPLTKYSENDVEINGKYYPNPFQYNDKEKNILQFFEKQNKKLSDLYYVNVYNKLSENEKKLFFEIVERPKENFPYYQVNTYDYRKKDLGMLYRFKFLVSDNGKIFYAIDDVEKKVPFEEWFENEMKEAKQFQKKHSDNPNKLNP